MYEINDWVVIVGCVINDLGRRSSVNFTVAKIIEVGIDDLIVKPNRSFSCLPLFVSKNSCRKIPVDDIDVTNDLRKPQIGDLVLYYHAKWSGETERTVGYVLEMKYDPGRPREALVLTDGENKWLEYNKLLVLELPIKGVK